METLAVVGARVAGLLPDGTLPASARIDFAGDAGTFPTVPVDAGLAGQPQALARLRGRIVVLGTTAPAGGDPAHPTPVPGRSVMSGPELQANAISTVIQDFSLRNGGNGVDVALNVLLAWSRSRSR